MAKRESRFTSKGQVFISEVTNTDALLKNLSTSGLCIESTDVIDVLPKTRYSVDIIPEKESNIDQFSLEIESRWVKAKMKSSESGFVIVIPPGTSGKTVLEQYLAYLATQPSDEDDEEDAEEDNEKTEEKDKKEEKED